MHVTWFASYPKSGNTWLCFLLSAYFFDELETWDAVDNVVITYAKHYGLAKRAGESNDVLWQRLIGLRREQPARPQGFPDDLFLKTHHLASTEHPFFDCARRAVLLVRNPRDIATSAINYSHLTQRRVVDDEKKYLEQFYLHKGDPAWKRHGIGSWPEHANSWLGHRGFPVLLVKYEDLHADVLAQFERIVRFIGAPVDHARLQRAADQASFDNLRRLEVARKADKPHASTKAKRFFINRGQVRNCLTSIDADLDLRFQEAFADGMRQLGYAAQDPTSPSKSPSATDVLYFSPPKRCRLSTRVTDGVDLTRAGQT